MGNPGSNHPLYTSSGCPTSHNAPAIASRTPLIEAEKLGIFIQTTVLAFLRLPNPLSDDEPDLST